MRFSRAVPLIVAAWVALVTMGSTVVWGVISAAGQDVVTADAPVALGTAPASSVGSGRTPGEAHRPSMSPTRTAAAAAAAAAAAVATATATPRPAPPATADHASLAASAPALPVALPAVSRSVARRSSSPSPTLALRAARSATWQGLGGLVTAQCVGAAISLVDAEPADGYALEVEDPGPDRVTVELDGAGESEVRASCVSGTPSFVAVSD